MIFRDNVTMPPAVIFFRFKGNDPAFAGLILLECLKNKTYQLDNCFTVIEKDNVRQRRY